MRRLPGIGSPSLTLLLVCVLVSNEVLGNVSASTRKFSANETFFKGTFSACKGLRLLNPVEAVRAHVFATKAVNGLGIKKLARYATELKVPSYTIYSLGERTCLLYSIVYAHLSKRENLLLSKNFATDVFLAAVERVLIAAEKGCPIGLTRWHTGMNFTMPWSTAKALISISSRVVLAAGNKHPPSDLNVLLHTIDYFRSILL